MNINIENFKMSYDSFKNLECTVPCSMYSVLLKHGIIDDPYFGLNELDLTAYSDKDCVFEAEFDITDDIIQREYVELELYGIDTHGEQDIQTLKDSIKIMSVYDIR